MVSETPSASTIVIIIITLLNECEQVVGVK